MATQQEIINIIVGSIMADDGAGSDLEYKDDYDENTGYMEVRGNLDVSQLASEILAHVTQALTPQYGVYFIKAMKDHKKDSIMWLDVNHRESVEAMVAAFPDKMELVTRENSPVVHLKS